MSLLQTGCDNWLWCAQALNDLWWMIHTDTIFSTATLHVRPDFL
jgi:hypothetical protein